MGRVGGLVSSSYGLSGADCFGLYGQVTKRARWMPWQPEAMKDVVACDKLRLGGKQPFDPEISEWGNPPVVRRVSVTESIGNGGERGELKHLSTRRNRNQLRFRQ